MDLEGSRSSTHGYHMELLAKWVNGGDTSKQNGTIVPITLCPCCGARKYLRVQGDHEDG